MKLLIMRHGETFWNTEGRLQGQADIPLDENGRKMAVSCGEGMREVPVDLCISSPLSRARDTAELVMRENRGYRQRAAEVLEELKRENGKLPATAKCLALPERAGAKSCFPVLTDTRLVEAGFGPWEGLICREDGYSVPLEDFSTYWRNPESPEIPDSVERLPAVAGRFSSFLADLTAAEALRDKTVLVVVHGCVMRAVMHIAGGRKNFNGKVPLNCEIIEAEPVGRDGLRELGRKIYYDASLVHDYYATMKQE